MTYRISTANLCYPRNEKERIFFEELKQLSFESPEEIENYFKHNLNHYRQVGKNFYYKHIGFSIRKQR